MERYLIIIVKARIAPLLLLPLMLAMAGSLYAAYAEPLEASLTFRALVRVNGSEAESAEVTLAPGENETLTLEGGYLLEFSAPEDNLTYASARLLEREGGEPVPRHTLRQPWRGEGWPTLGYLICGQRLSFFPLADGEALPECSR